MSDPTRTTVSAHLVGNSIDLIFELLLRLPVSAILRFRTVSKLWLSLSSSPYFLISHSRHHNLYPKPSALLLHSNETYPPTFINIPLVRDPVPTPSLTFAEDDLGIRVLQSCNGLLLCYSNYKLTDGVNGSLYVLNPTFKCFKTIPYPKFRTLDEAQAHFTLVFNPSEAPRFTIISTWTSEMVLQNRYSKNQSFRIELFSSDTCSWRLLGEFSFQMAFVKQLACGVFWKRAVHWLDPTTGPLCFDLKKEQPKPIPAPPLHKDDIFTIERFTYLGVCNNQLSIIEARNSTSQFLDVLQLQSHDSNWELKYHISLEKLGTGYPEIIKRRREIHFGFGNGYGYSTFRHFYLYSILSLVEDNDDGNLAIVLAIPGKIISFNQVLNTTKKLCSLPDDSDDQCDVYRFKWMNAHKLIQSFAPV